MVKEYIDKDTTIIDVLNKKEFVSRQNSSEDTGLVYELIYKEDDDETRINYITLEFIYWTEEEDDDEELSEKCNKALFHKDEKVRNTQLKFIPALKTLKISDANYIDMKENRNIWGMRGYEMILTFNVYEVELHVHPMYDEDDLETAPDDKYVIIGKHFNNITNMKLFKNGIEIWSKKVSARKNRKKWD